MDHSSISPGHEGLPFTMEKHNKPDEQTRLARLKDLLKDIVIETLSASAERKTELNEAKRKVIGKIERLEFRIKKNLEDSRRWSKPPLPRSMISEDVRQIKKRPSTDKMSPAKRFMGQQTVLRSAIEEAEIKKYRHMKTPAEKAAIEAKRKEAAEVKDDWDTELMPAERRKRNRLKRKLTEEEQAYLENGMYVAPDDEAQSRGRNRTNTATRCVKPEESGSLYDKFRKQAKWEMGFTTLPELDVDGNDETFDNPEEAQEDGDLDHDRSRKKQKRSNGLRSPIA